MEIGGGRGPACAKNRELMAHSLKAFAPGIVPSGKVGVDCTMDGSEVDRSHHVMILARARMECY